LAAHGVDGLVLLTDRQGDPFVPGAGREAWSVEREASSGESRASYSMSRPVATLVAIMQNASWGVRTLMACQLRLRTSTVAFVNMLIQFTIYDLRFTSPYAIYDLRITIYESLYNLRFTIYDLRVTTRNVVRCLFFVDGRIMFGIKIIFKTA
jgi:hypothetical protein